MSVFIFCWHQMALQKQMLIWRISKLYSILLRGRLFLMQFVCFQLLHLPQRLRIPPTRFRLEYYTFINKQEWTRPINKGFLMCYKQSITILTSNFTSMIDGFFICFFHSFSFARLLRLHQFCLKLVRCEYPRLNIVYLINKNYSMLALENTEHFYLVKLRINTKGF